MHERTRRNLCQLAFLAFGVLPTLGTLAWTAYRASPLYAAVERLAWENRLGALTGLSAKVGQIEHPTWDTTLLHELHLIDPDGGQRVARIRQVDIGLQPEGVVVLLSQPEVSQGKFLRIWDTLHDRILRGPAPSADVQIRTGEFTLEVGKRAQTFTAVQCTISRRPPGAALATDPPNNSSSTAETNRRGADVQADIQFQLAGVEMPIPARLLVERCRQASPPTTHWTLQSNVPIPCDVFTDYLPLLSQLGDRATFQGNVSVALQRASWSGQLSGQFLQVDLRQLTNALPHRLSGTANVRIDQAFIEQGVLNSATGAVISHGGTVSRSLISSLAQHLSLSTPEVVLAESAPLTGYDLLAFQFAISGEGFSLAGFNDRGDETMLTAAGQPLLAGDSQARYPLAALVRALTPESQYLVPATEAIKPLINWLDLPAPRPANLPTDEPPTGRLRWSERSR